MRKSDAERSKDSYDRHKGEPEWRATKNARGAQWSKANRQKTRVYVRNATLKKMGFTVELYEALWTWQDGRCALCRRELVRGGQAPDSVAADHDHTSGKARGLLCSICNRSLGNYEKHQQGRIFIQPYEDYLAQPPALVLSLQP